MASSLPTIEEKMQRLHAVLHHQLYHTPVPQQHPMPSPSSTTPEAIIIKPHRKRRAWTSYLVIPVMMLMVVGGASYLYQSQLGITLTGRSVPKTISPTNTPSPTPSPYSYKKTK